MDPGSDPGFLLGVLTFYGDTNPNLFKDAQKPMKFKKLLVPMGRVADIFYVEQPLE